MTIRLPVLWGDLDALGHVNNTRYLTWFESARIAYFERIGLAVDNPTSVGPILATTTCDFLIPLRYPADVEVVARVTRVGTKSFTMVYTVSTVGGDAVAVCAKGTAVVVLVDYGSGETVALSDDMRSAIETVEG